MKSLTMALFDTARVGRSDSQSTVRFVHARYVAEFAEAIRAESLWLEATQNSAEAYQQIFELENVRDLVVLNAAQYTSFRNSMRQRQGSES